MKKNKYMLIADLHLHQVPKWRYKWNEDFISKSLNEQNDQDLVILGDVFELKNKLDSTVLNQFIRFIGQWKNKVYWITGQHDSYLPNVCTLEGLKDFNIVIIDKTVQKITENVYAIPYCRDLKLYRDLLATIPSESIVLTHLPIREALAPFMTDGKDMIEVNEFHRFSKVLSGDIHKYGEYGNFEYVGAVSQRDFRDIGCDGVFGKLCVGNGEYGFTRYFTDCPVHIKAYKQDDIPKNKECIVRVFSDKISIDNPKVLASSASIYKDIEVHRLNNLDIKNNSAIIDTFLKTQELEDSDKEKYSKVAVALIEEAKNV